MTSQQAVLASLREHGPMRLRDVAEKSGVQFSTASSALYRAEGLGLAERIEHGLWAIPGDRRVAPSTLNRRILRLLEVHGELHLLDIARALDWEPRRLCATLASMVGGGQLVRPGPNRYARNHDGEREAKPVPSAESTDGCDDPLSECLDGWTEAHARMDAARKCFLCRKGAAARLRFVDDAEPCAEDVELALREAFPRSRGYLLSVVHGALTLRPRTVGELAGWLRCSASSVKATVARLEHDGKVRALDDGRFGTVQSEPS